MSSDAPPPPSEGPKPEDLEAAGPAPVENESPSPGDTPAKPAKRSWGRRIWKWTKRAAIGLVVLLIVARIALPFVLPSIVDSVLAGQGLAGRYEDLDLSLITGDIRLWHFELFPAPPEGQDEPDPEQRLAHLEYAHVDLDMSALLTLDLTVHRVEVDGLDLYLERQADGSIRWPEAPPSEDEPEPEPEPEEPSDEPLRFESPVRIDAVRAQHLRVHLTDASVEPAQETWVEASVRVSNVGHPEFPAIVRLSLHSPDVLDLARVELEARTGETLDATFEATVQGLHPHAAAPWLAPMGIEARAHAIDVRLGGSLGLSADEARTVHSDVALGPWSIAADGAAAVELDAIRAHAAIGDALSIGDVVIEGVRARARRDAAGIVEAAGLAFVPAPPAAASPTPAPMPGPEPPLAAVADEDAPPTPWQLAGVRISGVAVAFEDDAVGPTRNLRFDLSSVDVGAIELAAPDADTEIAIDGTLPNVAESLSVRATVRPLATALFADATLTLDGITLAEVAPYLEQAGLEPEFESGRLSLTAEVRGTDEGGIATAELRDLTLTDGETQHLAFASAAVTGLRTEGADTHIERVAVQGLSLPTSRDAEGILHFVGLRTAPAAAPVDATAQPQAGAAEPASDPASEPASSQEPAGALHLAELRVDGIAWEFDDAAVDPAVALRSELAIRVQDLVLGGEPAAGRAADRAQIEVVGSVGEALRSLSLTGTVDTRPGPLDVAADLQLGAEAIDWRPLQPYLTGASIETTDETGTLRGRIRAAAQQLDEVLTASLDVSELAVGPADDPWLALAGLEVRGLRAGPDGTALEAVTIRGPSARAARDADGVLHVLGLRLMPAVPEPPAEDAPPPETQPVADTAPRPSPAAADPAADPAPFRLDQLTLEGATIRWQDAQPTPAVATEVTIGANVRGLDTTPGANPAAFGVRIAVPGDLDSLRIDGTSTIDPTDLRTRVELALDGLRSGPLAAYLPPGTEITMTDGRLRMALKAELREAPSGSQSVVVALDGLALTDGERPLVSVAELSLDVPTLDLGERPGAGPDDEADGGTLQIAELALRGVTAEATNTPDGLEIAGMRFGPPPVADPEDGAPSPGPEAPAAAVGGDPAPAAAAAAGESTEPVLPTVGLDKLEIELARFRYRDTTGETAAEPLDLSARIRNVEPWVLLRPDPEELAPLALALEAAATPLVDAVRVDVTAAPWAADPHFTLDLAVDGIHGDRITDVLPSLAETLHGRELANGTFTTKADALLSLRRRFPTDIDLSRGFGVEATIEDVHLRAEPDGPLLVGVNEVLVEAPAISPSRTQIKLAEIHGVHGTMVIDDEGTHVAGITLLAPPQPAEGEGDPEDAPQTGDPVAEPEPTPVADTGSETEFRLDNLLVSGVTFTLEDRTTEVPLIVPITNVDLELQRFTTRAFSEPIPMSFAAIVNAGEVPLPKRAKASSLLAGMLSAAGRALSGGDDEAEIENRPMLDEFALQGRIQFYPALDGRIRSSLSGLELTALRGPASAAGVEIGDGIYDSGIDVRMDQGAVRANASFAFGDLSLDEPPDGLISSYLKLPAPLDAVLFALKDESDQITIPLEVEVGKGGELDPGALAAEAVSVLGSIIADAVAASPFRAAGAVTGALGFGGGEAEDLSQRRRNLLFSPASTELPEDVRMTLMPLVERCLDDETIGLVLTHRFGVRDLELAMRRANPGREATAALLEGLRQDRTELQIDREAAGAAAQVHLATGRRYLAQRETARLRALDEELAEIEDAIDQAVRLLRPGAERRAPRRTKATALGIGNTRLLTIRRWLIEQLGPGGEDRVEVRKARLAEPAGTQGGIVTTTPVRRQVAG